MHLLELFLLVASPRGKRVMLVIWHLRSVARDLASANEASLSRTAKEPQVDLENAVSISFLSFSSRELGSDTTTKESFRDSDPSLPLP